jgi:hypothetical protein
MTQDTDVERLVKWVAKLSAEVFGARQIKGGLSRPAEGRP